MFSITSKVVSRLGCLLLITSILTSCSTSIDENINFSEYEYIVSLSRMFEPNAKLLFINKDGETSKEIDYDGVSINSINLFNNKLYLSSNRKNEHFTINNSGQIKKYTLLYEKYKDTDVDFMASWFATVGDKTIIESMNIGGENGEYLSNIIYSYGDNINEYIFKGQYLTNAIDFGDKIYVNSYLSDKNKHIVSEIDKVNNKLIREIFFSNDYTASNKTLVRFEDGFLIYGDNQSIISQKGNKISSLAFINFDDDIEIKEIEFNFGDIIAIYNDNEKIKVVSSDKVIYVYDKILNLIDKELIADDTCVEDYKKYELIKVIDRADKISMVYYYDKMDNSQIAFIQEYEKNNFKLGKKIDLKLDNTKIWMGEKIDVITP